MQQLLIIVDGLDECTDKIEQSDVLSGINNALATSDFPLRFFISSRPESRIRTRFERPDLLSATVHFVLDIDDTATQDIVTYLKTEFSRIREEHCIRIRETPWPPEDAIQSLAERASEQFVYAATIIKFLDDRHLQPQERLDVVLGILPHGTFSPFAKIDFLYTQILDACLKARFSALGQSFFLGIHFESGASSSNLGELSTFSCIYTQYWIFDQKFIFAINHSQIFLMDDALTLTKLVGSRRESDNVTSAQRTL